MIPWLGVEQRIRSVQVVFVQYELYQMYLARILNERPELERWHILETRRLADYSRFLAETIEMWTPEAGMAPARDGPAASAVHRNLLAPHKLAGDDELVAEDVLPGFRATAADFFLD